MAFPAVVVGRVQWSWLAVLAGVLAFVATGYGAVDRRAEEEKLIELLRSDAAVAKRAAACVRLQRIGTERAVPALAALLGDRALGHAARFALETLPGPAAGQALVAALETTTGDERLGVITSLAVRREGAAVPGLVRLLAATRGGPGDDAPRAAAGRETLAIAVVTALGAIDDGAARAALEGAGNHPEATVRAAVQDALLAHADRQRLRDELAEAARLFRGLLAQEQRPAVRVAAHLGLFQTAGPELMPSWRAALLGEPGPEQTAALQAITLLAWPGVDATLQEILPLVPPERQYAVLEGWIQRRVPPARAIVRPLLASPDPAVRLAAIRALGQIGAAEDVERLLDLAATTGAAQAAPREALARLRAPVVSAQLIARLPGGREVVRREAARALGERGDPTAAPPLLALVRDEADEVRRTALRALALVLPPGEVGELVRLVASAANGPRQGELVRALALVYERLQPGAGATELVPLVRELQGGPASVRATLWGATAAVVAPELRAVWRSALNDGNPAVRSAAIRAASLTNDIELLPDLRGLACRDASEEHRELATRACLRLLARPGARLALAERLELMRAIATSAPTPVQQRLLLAGLASGGTPAELELAERFLVEAAVWNEAAAAVVKIAPRLTDAAIARAALRTVGAAEVGAELRKEIDAALAIVEARAPYVTSWQVSAPLPIAGVDAESLLAAELPPEAAGADFRTREARARLARWTPLALGSDARSPMVLRGGGPEAFGVVYTFTWLWSPAAQPARLELWHDGGARAWLGSGPLPLSPVEEVGLPPRPGASVAITLTEGWNLLRVKLVQPAKGWAFAVRISGQNGAPLPGLVADAGAGPGN